MGGVVAPVVSVAGLAGGLVVGSLAGTDDESGDVVSGGGNGVVAGIVLAPEPVGVGVVLAAEVAGESCGVEVGAETVGAVVVLAPRI